MVKPTVSSGRVRTYRQLLTAISTSAQVSKLVSRTKGKHVWVVIGQIADGTVFWPSVLASLVTVLAVGGRSWVIWRRRRALQQTDPVAADRYRRQTGRWSLIVGVSGLVLIGLVVAWLSL